MSAEHDPVLQEQDVMPRRLALSTTTVIVSVTLGGIAVAGLVLRLTVGPAPAAPEAMAAAREVSGIEQSLVVNDSEGLRRSEAQRKELESYRWVDRQRGLVQIPIQRAMELVAQGAQP